MSVQVHAVEQTLDALHSAVLESVEKQFYNGASAAALDLDSGEPAVTAESAVEVPSGGGDVSADGLEAEGHRPPGLQQLSLRVHGQC